jgi:hypothetical protein
MRDYGRLASTMWTKGSGKRIRGNFAAQAVACYLASAPGSHMLGLYHVTIATIASEMGHEPHEIRKALVACEAAGLAFYDEDAELAWVPNVASIELGDGLAVKDKRRDGIKKYLRSIGSHRFVDAFIEKYGKTFGLGEVGHDVPIVSPPTPPYSVEEGGNNPPSNGAGAGAGAGAGYGSGESRGGPLPTQSPPPVPGFFGDERVWFQEAVRTATGNKSYVPPLAARCGMLLEVIRARPECVTSDRAKSWLTTSVLRFVPATESRRRAFTLSPDGWAKWVGEGEHSSSEMDARDAHIVPRGRQLQTGIDPSIRAGKDF